MAAAQISRAAAQISRAARRLAQPQGQRRGLDARLTQAQVQVVGGGVGAVAHHHPGHVIHSHRRVVVGRDEPPLLAQFSHGPPVRAEIEVGQVEAIQLRQGNRFLGVQFADGQGLGIGRQGDDLGN